MSETTLPPVARKVFYPCKKCECERYQVVVTHTSKTAAKLECEVCHTKNTMKLVDPSRPVKEPKAPKAGAKPKKSNARTSSLSRWTEYSNKNIPSKPYSMKEKFQADQSVEHPRFGVGFVTQVQGQSMIVLFQDGERTLVHSRA